MTFKVEGLLGAEEMILNLDMTWKRRVSERLYDQAHELAELAGRMAPVDEGHLEGAIMVSPDEDIGERMRNAAGRFERIEYKVYIDMTMDAPKENSRGDIIPSTADKKVGDYAYYVHEYVTPAGGDQLGPESIDKQERDSSVKVGGAFMTRAAEEIEKTIVGKIISEFAPAPRWPGRKTYAYHHRMHNGHKKKPASTYKHKNPKFR